MGSETMPSKQDVPREWSVVDHKQLLPNKYIMKWDEGMLKQCYSVGDLYHAWIDHPKLRRVRMFDSDYFEAASFTPWWIVPAIYVPWALLELDLSHQNFLSLPTESDALYSVSVNLLINSLHIPPILLSLFLFFIGVTLWTLFEYFVHKHAFHWTPPSANWNLAHFVGHGLHHLTPADKYRLVFPPAISFPLGLAMRFFFLYYFHLEFVQLCLVDLCVDMQHMKVFIISVIMHRLVVFCKNDLKIILRIILIQENKINYLE